jgi:hypothetical protein
LEENKEKKKQRKARRCRAFSDSVLLIRATRVFTEMRDGVARHLGEDTHSLRLTSKLVDLRSGYANRILLRPEWG